ncbi:MAG: hypothetical protein ACT6FB_02840, partial [Methanosarcinaceae archaeon]
AEGAEGVESPYFSLRASALSAENTFCHDPKHLVDFFDLGSAKAICCSEAKRVPVIIILKYVLNSDGWFE